MSAIVRHRASSRGVNSSSIDAAATRSATCLSSSARAAGSVAVSAGLLRYLGPDSSTTLLSVPAGEHAGVLAMRQGKIVALVMVSVRHGTVDHIDALVDPVKLAPISDALGI